MQQEGSVGSLGQRGRGQLAPDGQVGEEAPHLRQAIALERTRRPAWWQSNRKTRPMRHVWASSVHGGKCLVLQGA
jgi:hypothetical protein